MSKINAGLLPAFAFIAVMFFCGRANAATGDNSVPDFAYPVTVEKNSKAKMEQSLKSKDWLHALRYAFDVCIAQNQLAQDYNVAPSMQLLDSVASLSPQPYKSVAYLMEAHILSCTYSANRSVFNSRKLPLETPWPENTDAWSGDMFKTSVYDLVDKATQSLNELWSNKISNISLLLTNTKEAEKIKLSTGDFIAFRGAFLLEQFNSTLSATVIPFYPEQMAATIEGKCMAKAEDLLTQVALNASKRQATVVEALAYRYISDLKDDNEREAYLLEKTSLLKNKEGEGCLLYVLWERYGDDTKKWFDEISRSLKKHPSGYFSPQLKYAIDRMSQQTMQSQFPNLSLTKTPIKGNVSGNNINTGYLLVYKLTKNEYDDSDQLILKNFNPNSTPVKIIPLSAEGEIPFSFEKEVEIEGLEAGMYAVIPSLSTSPAKDWKQTASDGMYSLIRVTDIAIIKWSNTPQPDFGRVFVVDAHNQAPVEGAEVEYIPTNKSLPAGKLVTNKYGFAKIPDGYYRLRATYKDNVAVSTGGFSHYKRTEVNAPYATVLTDLAIYHPGDTVKFAVIGWLQQKYSNSVIKNSPVTVTLLDANYTPADTLSLQLDAAGRASGSFIIPSGRLLGNYHINTAFPEYDNRGGGMASFSVEEYRLPSFFVTLSQQDTHEEGELKFSGDAVTFTGLPVSSAQTEVKVEYIPWLRWGARTKADYTFNTSTDSDGNFTFSLPVKNLKGTPFATGRFSVTATTTSPAGETQKSAPLLFYLGKGLDIRPAFPDIIPIESDSVKLDIPVFDMGGLPVKEWLEYSFVNVNDTSVRLTGKFISPTLTLDADKIPSGKYRPSFSTPDGEFTVTTETVFYRPSDNKAPYPTPLWIPKKEYVIPEGRRSVIMKFGSYYSDWILMSLGNSEERCNTDWFQPQDSLINLGIDFPEDYTDIFMDLIGMHDFEVVSERIHITWAKNLKKLDVSTESFRDKITAGNKENWTFKFHIGQTPAAGTNVFAVMTDKALNSLRDFKWHMNIWKQGIYDPIHLTTDRVGLRTSYRNFNKMPTYRSVPDPIPDWETYGFGFERYFTRGSGQITNSMRRMKAAATTMATDDFGAMKEESMEMAEDTAMAGGSEAGQVDDTPATRPSEMPVAFFMTDLKTDDEGMLNLNFTVPDYNTTWQLQLAGYTDNMLNTTLSLDAMATKPVMAKSNLPGFLRTGDKAEISATLYNNSPDNQQIAGKIVIIDPISGTVLKKESFPAQEVNPSANRVITVQFEVPDTVSSVAVKSFALTGSHSDGEQGLVPVLSSSTPVTEASTFYLRDKQETLEMKVPELDKKASVTLKYCDNPLWDVLLSLPSMKDNTGKSSWAVADWLFSTILSKDIFDSNAAIKEGLSRIFESSDMSLTQSALEKESELKIVALEASPWVNNAASETARIRGLQEYLKPEKVTENIARKSTELLQLQLPDGGFTWFEGMKSSPFITRGILSRMGYLKACGLLPAGLEAAAGKAVRFCDNALIESVKRDKGFDVTGTMRYLYSRRLLGVSASSEMKAIENRCVDSIYSQWRYWDVKNKAMGALLLHKTGNRHKVVADIEASLKEFLGIRLGVEEEALLLTLFGESNDEEAVETVREKMFLQKETESWGDNGVSPVVMYSLVASTPKSNVKRGLPRIFIDGKPLELPTSQALTGSFTINLDPDEVSGKTLSIQRSAGLPAWGGIVSQYITPLTKVKETKVENLSVTKHEYLYTDTGEVQQVKSYRQGDRIRVVLNVDCGKDMDYIVIRDARAACLQTDDNISGIVWVDGEIAYREIGKERTSFFIEHLPAGSHVISYDCHIDREGVYASGIAEIQCLISPAQVAHSAATLLVSEE